MILTNDTYIKKLHIMYTRTFEDCAVRFYNPKTKEITEHIPTLSIPRSRADEIWYTRSKF